MGLSEKNFIKEVTFDLGHGGVSKILISEDDKRQSLVFVLVSFSLPVERM